MSEQTQADRYLLDQISRGDSDGWSQLVSRYQGRLLAFARSRLARKSEAEDLVQDTFVTFLQQIKSFKPDHSIETFLFTILRRRIIDMYRGKKFKTCFIHDVLDPTDQGDSSTAELTPGHDMSASFYVRRDERDERQREILGAALLGFITRLRDNQNFRDLKIAEALFFAQLRNKDIGKMLGMDEKAIALIKHRALKEIHENVLKSGGGGLEEPEGDDARASILTEVWEDLRLSCPKRSTLGRHLLGTLDTEWKDYIDFHVNKLGCTFCRANVEDLQKQTAEAPKALFDKVLQSTIGFFKRP
jgi:RNA polymerase sigma factor (sigma-70 family)